MKMLPKIILYFLSLAFVLAACGDDSNHGPLSTPYSKYKAALDEAAKETSSYKNYNQYLRTMIADEAQPSYIREDAFSKFLNRFVPGNNQSKADKNDQALGDYGTYDSEDVDLLLALSWPHIFSNTTSPSKDPFFSKVAPESFKTLSFLIYRSLIQKDVLRFERLVINDKYPEANRSILLDRAIQEIFSKSVVVNGITLNARTFGDHALDYCLNTYQTGGRSNASVSKRLLHSVLSLGDSPLHRSFYEAKGEDAAYAIYLLDMPDSSLISLKRLIELAASSNPNATLYEEKVVAVIESYLSNKPKGDATIGFRADVLALVAARYHQFTPAGLLKIVRLLTDSTSRGNNEIFKASLAIATGLVSKLNEGEPRSSEEETLQTISHLAQSTYEWDEMSNFQWTSGIEDKTKLIKLFDLFSSESEQSILYDSLGRLVVVSLGADAKEHSDLVVKVLRLNSPVATTWILKALERTLLSQREDIYLKIEKDLYIPDSIKAQTKQVLGQ